MKTIKKFQIIFTLSELKNLIKDLEKDNDTAGIFEFEIRKRMTDKSGLFFIIKDIKKID